jgi:hypothetical protein
MFEAELEKLTEQGLLRQLIARASNQGPVIVIGRKNYINFSSNDYLGLANHPDLVKAVTQAMQKQFSAGASDSCRRTVLLRSLKRPFCMERSGGFYTTQVMLQIRVRPAEGSDLQRFAEPCPLIEATRLNRAKTVY